MSNLFSRYNQTFKCEYYIELIYNYNNNNNKYLFV